jgi:hypothetical protein
MRPRVRRRLKSKSIACGLRQWAMRRVKIPQSRRIRYPLHAYNDMIAKLASAPLVGPADSHAMAALEHVEDFKLAVMGKRSDSLLHVLGSVEVGAYHSGTRNLQIGNLQ